ncbi:MAG: HDOD domain-containing protein [Pseudomonadota bacterium]
MSAQPAKSSDPRPTPMPMPMVSTASLPALLPASGYLVNRLSDPELDARSLPSVIEKAPVIAGRILALANSAWSAPAVPVTSLELACRRLGLNMIRTVGVAMAVSQPFRPVPVSGFNAIRFWASSLLAADAGYLLAEPLAPESRESARTAALLARLGILWLVENRPEDLARAIALMQADGDLALNDALRQCCGFGHVEISQQLAEHWRLPDVLCAAIARQKAAAHVPDEEPVTLVVANATRMCFAVTHQRDFEPDGHLLPSLKVDAERQLDAFEKLRKEAPAIRSLAFEITG